MRGACDAFRTRLSKNFGDIWAFLSLGAFFPDFSFRCKSFFFGAGLGGARSILGALLESPLSLVPRRIAHSNPIRSNSRIRSGVIVEGLPWQKSLYWRLWLFTHVASFVKSKV